MKKFARRGNILTIAFLAFGLAFFCAQRPANAGGVSLNIESGHTTFSVGIGNGGAGFYIGSTKNVAPAFVVAQPAPPAPSPRIGGAPAPGGSTPIIRGQSPAPRGVVAPSPRFDRAPDRRPDPRGGMTAQPRRAPGEPRAMNDRVGAPRPTPGGAYRPR